MTDDDMFRVDSFDDLMNALPTLFGFVPRECVIGLAVSGPTCRFGFRLRHDLPLPGDEEALAAGLAEHLVRHGREGFFLFALSDNVERARLMVTALRDALPPGRAWLVLWADDRRVWSATPGHPAEGEPYALDRHHEAIVRAVAQGQVILADRSALADEVAPPAEQDEERLDRAHDAALERFLERATTTAPASFLASERERVARLVERGLDGADLGEADLVELAVLTSSMNVRDAVWVGIGRANARGMHRLWAAVSRVASPDFAPAPLCLAGFAAWQMGDGARALVALDRALRLEPRYRMGLLLQDVLEAGVHPDRWAQADVTA
ncbi:DUF4192 domain-containing protein [Aeromicrobium duanguangcaii]|uniref:DUF4192 domain-containing protein n=1 Tax=Aeromicrobium duanguangcaii TaxID=2968086 RepID=A0ABY5KE59_9ACTN|nr:DUF4192 domain-containing protein [Aeromicrobium duanguangcaii]MCL3837340.1 DUF4192 domain-containing protein [Aeromicrobium duanguangcaii]UUI67372.1 DUF4192 domain-containing protein [Aeromicrobium duanguangcaii]